MNVRVSQKAALEADRLDAGARLALQRDWRRCRRSTRSPPPKIG
ncbi:MAG TPA: hypothetical protein VF911_07865 [Thermoanaerobaculia bacterium]|jgi:hypothetical protein